MNLPNMKRPCGNCPFRKDTLKGWLGKGRMTEILDSNTFTCHKKIDKQCAGHMLIKGQENEFVRLSDLMNLDTGLSGRELIFDTDQDCIDHHTP